MPFIAFGFMVAAAVAALTSHADWAFWLFVLGLIAQALNCAETFRRWRYKGAPR